MQSGAGSKPRQSTTKTGTVKRKEPNKSKGSVRTSTQKEIKDFMGKQAHINENILVQLQALGNEQKDKCGRATSTSGASGSSRGSGGGGKVQKVNHQWLRILLFHPL